MRIMKIGNQPTGTNQPTSNPSQPAFKMQFSTNPRHVKELDKLFKKLETLSPPELRTKLESNLLFHKQKKFNGFQIYEEHPIVNIKSLVEMDLPEYSGYKVQITFKDPKSGKLLKTNSTGRINRFQVPRFVALELMDVIEEAFNKMEPRVAKEAKKAANSAKKPIQEFINKMNAKPKK